MWNSLTEIDTIISIVVLILLCIVLYLQIRLQSSNQVWDKGKTSSKIDEISPVLCFYSGKIHRNGIVSMKVKNSGGKIKNISFSSELDNIDFRSVSEQLITDQDMTISLVPISFNFSQKYFDSNDLFFAIKYTTLLNETYEDMYKIEDIHSIYKIGSKKKAGVLNPASV